MLTGIVGRAKACAGRGWVGKDEAGKEMVFVLGTELSRDVEFIMLFVLDDTTELRGDVEDAVEESVAEAICCIFPSSKF